MLIHHYISTSNTQPVTWQVLTKCLIHFEAIYWFLVPTGKQNDLSDIDMCLSRSQHTQTLLEIYSDWLARGKFKS